ncbi:MAG: class I SAM-dependent methyltransferase [Chloroflexi bacterium]|nr:class I SAM-dependent methyltransferase [Chloroflexota bacterium]
MTTKTTCWCGNTILLNYSPDYALCDKCNSLVRKIWPDEEPARVSAPDHFGRIPADLKEDELRARLQKDMSTFIPRALGALLKFCLPPASVFELGSAHGGFVAVLRAAGYNATGFEAGASLAEFALKTFDVQSLGGAFESQKIEKGSLDALVALNSLERMENPAETMRLALELLKPGGILLLQTPCFESEKTFEELLLAEHPILPNFDEPQRMRFFSTQSLEKFFHELGWNVSSEAPMTFGDYNMFAVVSQGEVGILSQEESEKTLETSLSGLLTLALVNARATADEMQFHAEGRQKTIHEQTAGLENLRNIIQAQGAEVEMLRKVAQERLELIQKLDEALKNATRK